MIEIHLALCPAAADSWLDPGPVSQVLGAIIGSLCSVGIALAVWRAEGKRLRTQIEDETRDRKRSAHKLVLFDLSKMRKGIARLLVMTDEALINSHRGPLVLIATGNGRVSRTRLSRMIESWFDTEALWVHMNPSLVRPEVIEAVGNLLAEHDDIAAELIAVAPKAFNFDDFRDRLSELQDRLRALDGRINHAISVVEDAVAGTGG